MKKDSLGFIMVCNIGGQLGTKVVISALGMLTLYMRFNGTGIWGGETMYASLVGETLKPLFINCSMSLIRIIKQRGL